MANIKVVNMAGKEVGSVELNDAVFAAPVNEAVLHAAVKTYLANQRQGTQSALTRTEVSGGGKKPRPGVSVPSEDSAPEKAAGGGVKT